MIDFIQVGKKLANYRKQNNMTQDDLASMLFVTRQLISKWEKGVGVPSLDVVIELSKIFKVSIEDLLCLNDEEEFDKEDIFKGHTRLFVIESIISKKLDIDLPSNFYKFSLEERMMLLKAVKEGRLDTDISKLKPVLTISEYHFLKGDN